MNDKIMKYLKPFIVILLYLEVLPILLTTISFKNSQITILVRYIVLLVIMILLFRKKYIEDFKTFKKEYLLDNLKYYIYGLLGMLLFNLIINFIIPGGIPENEAMNREFFKSFPLIFIIEVALLGPICEELTFRMNFDFIKNDKIFIYGSATIFSLVHVLNGITSPIELIYFFPYLSLGLSFGYIYRKTNNIHASIFYHMLHNSITAALIFLTI